MLKIHVCVFQVASLLVAAPGGVEDVLQEADRDHLKVLLTNQSCLKRRVTATGTPEFDELDEFEEEVVIYGLCVFLSGRGGGEDPPLRLVPPPLLPADRHRAPSPIRRSSGWSESRPARGGAGEGGGDVQRRSGGGV